jgi:hypothetical protein
LNYRFSFIKDLANATGNILENKELLQSLNKTKEKSATITNSLEESVKLGEDLDKVKNKNQIFQNYNFINKFNSRKEMIIYHLLNMEANYFLLYPIYQK